MVKCNVTTKVAYDTQKAALTSSTMLNKPNPDLTFILQMDTHNAGVGEVLSQQDSLGNNYASAYTCTRKRLLDEEWKNDKIENECLAK